MHLAVLRLGVFACVFAVCGVCLPAQVRDATAILRDYDAVVFPSMSDGTDAESLARFDRQVREAAESQQRLAQELMQVAPRHERIAEVMRRRWTLFCTVQKDAAPVFVETAAVDATSGSDLQAAAAGARALAATTVLTAPLDEREAIVRASFSVAPRDFEVEGAILRLVKYATASSARQKAWLDLLEPIAKRSREISREATRLRRLCDAVGTKFDLPSPGAAADPAVGQPLTPQGRPWIITFESNVGDYVSDTDRRETAALHGLVERWAPQGLSLVTVVTIDGSADAAVARAGLTARGYVWPVIVDDGGFEKSIPRARFGLAEGPLHLLLDKDGKLAAWTMRAANLSAEVGRTMPARRTKAV